MTITEFLKARLDEDEERASSGWSSLREERWENTNEGRSVMTPRAILADIVTKRAIVELAEEATSLDMQVDSEFRVGRRDEVAEPYVGDLILRRLAQPYADHPDFDPALRVS